MSVKTKLWIAFALSILFAVLTSLAVWIVTGVGMHYHPQDTPRHEMVRKVAVVIVSLPCILLGLFAWTRGASRLIRVATSLTGWLFLIVGVVLCLISLSNTILHIWPALLGLSLLLAVRMTRQEVA